MLSARRVSRLFRNAGAWFLLLAAVTSIAGCSDGNGASLENTGNSSDARLSDEECAHLLEVETTRVWIEDTLMPSAVDVAKDTLDPDGADRSKYGVVLGVEQRYENLLSRRMNVEPGPAELVAPSGDTYAVAPESPPPFALGPKEARVITYFVPLTADVVSPSEIAGLLDPGATAHVENDVHVEIPETDNCGYAGGPRVRTDGGTVGVERPGGGDAVTDLLSGILKAFAHGG